MHRLDIQRFFRSGRSMLGRNSIPPEETSSEALSDGVITARIRMKLLAHAKTAASEFHVRTVDGVVSLSGCVSNSEVRDVALQLAEHAEGVRNVIDEIDVRRRD